MTTRLTQATAVTDKRWRSALRALWLLFFAFGLLSFILAIVHQLVRISSGTGIEPDLIAFLTSLNLPFNFTRIYFRAWEAFTIFVVALLSLFVFLYRSDDWMALLVSLCSFYLILTLTALIYRYSQLLGMTIAVIATPLIFGTFFLFPSGEFKPAFTRWLLVPCCLLLASIIPALSRTMTGANTLSESLLLNAVGLMIIAVCVAAQVYRYFRVATPLQRQQTKWIVFALLLFFIIWVTSFILPLLLPPLRWAITYPEIGHFSLSSFLWALFMIGVLDTVSIAFFPVALVVSILRYRLWDVDVLINRSVVGFFVGLVLLCFFVPSAFLIQRLLGAENTALSYLVSAAIPALLFNPTRKRVRHLVDQRIYGLRFDLNELKSAQKAVKITHPGALSGRLLGKYEVLDVLGKGGMGEVYKGVYQGQTVALKTLASHLATEQDFLRRFQREAEVMRGLDHPNIVKLYDSGASDGQLYLVLEFIAGVDLKDYLRERGKLSIEEARKILSTIAAALDYLHGKDIVHRDIKPSNVMLRDGQPHQAVLMDFGIAKLDDGKTRLTGSGAIGTIDYMAPEQIMAAKEVDQRADIYALGLMAYEMLAGDTPFKGGAVQIMFAHLQQPPPDLQTINPGIPAPMAAAIQRALAKDPAERFDSAGDFAAALMHTQITV